MIIPSFSNTSITLSETFFMVINMKKARIDYESYIGKKIGKWTIKSYLKLKKRIHFLCSCECENISNIQASSLIIGKSKSCKFCASKKHGFYNTIENRSWNAARNRCYNPNNKDYKDYGGRGIKMCDQWNKFEKFLEDMGKKPIGYSLDRINNDGNYEPSNCRWATYSQQNSNQRKRYSSKLITKGN